MLPNRFPNSRLRCYSYCKVNANNYNDEKAAHIPNSVPKSLTIKDLAENITKSREQPLSEWKLSQHNGDRESILQKDSTKFPAVGKKSLHFASLVVKTVESAGAIFVLRANSLLQIVELKLSNNKISSNTGVFCDSVCSLSRILAQRAEKLKLTSAHWNLTVNGKNSQQI